MKNCSVCKCDKDISYFSRDSRAKTGIKSSCKSCDSQKNKELYLLKATEINRKNRERVRNKFKNDPNLYRNKALKQRFGISLEDKNKMSASQGDACKICLKHVSELEFPLCVDHDHRTGKIRDLLCRECNLAIGFLKDSVDTLKSAIDYLERHRDRL